MITSLMLRWYLSVDMLALHCVFTFLTTIAIVEFGHFSFVFKLRIHYINSMKKKMMLFTFLFSTNTACHYLFVDRNDIWGAWFVGFFSALFCAFVFIPLVEKPVMNVIKRTSEKLIHH